MKTPLDSVIQRRWRDNDSILTAEGSKSFCVGRISLIKWKNKRNQTEDDNHVRLSLSCGERHHSHYKPRLKHYGKTNQCEDVRLMWDTVFSLSAKTFVCSLLSLRSAEISFMSTACGNTELLNEANIINTSRTNANSFKGSVWRYKRH